MVFNVSRRSGMQYAIQFDFETMDGGTALEAAQGAQPPDEASFWHISNITYFMPGERNVRVGVPLLENGVSDDGETIMVRLVNAWLMEDGYKIGHLDLSGITATGTITDSD